MGKLSGGSGGVPDAPNVMNQPINTRPNFAGPNMESVNMAKGGNGGREIPDWQKKMGAGIAAGGNAYDRQNAPHAGPITNFDVSQSQLPPEYFQQQPYIQQAIQRYDPRQQGPMNPNAFYGG